MDLKIISGLPISIDENAMLVFSHTVGIKRVSHRTSSEMGDYLSSPNSRVTAGDLIYTVYHETSLMSDESAIVSASLRYDITTIYGGEFIFPSGEKEYYKTAGHYHPPFSGIELPEIYELLAGSGQWVIQRYRDEPSRIEEAYLIEASPGDKICIPPGFGHATVNIGKEPLVIANATAKDLGYDYKPFQELKGACYRILASNRYNMVEIERNTNYELVPDLVKLKPKKDWFKGCNDPLYVTLSKTPEALDFLSHPEQTRKDFFSIGRLYQITR